MPAHRVTVVRELGGTRTAPSAVRICKENIGTQIEYTEHDQEEWERFLAQRRADNQSRAELRGRRVERELAQQKWIQHKIQKAEREMRLSVELVERLRAARLVSSARYTTPVIQATTPVLQELTNQPTNRGQAQQQQLQQQPTLRHQQRQPWVQQQQQQQPPLRQQQQQWQRPASAFRRVLPEEKTKQLPAYSKDGGKKSVRHPQLPAAGNDVVVGQLPAANRQLPVRSQHPRTGDQSTGGRTPQLLLSRPTTDPRNAAAVGGSVPLLISSSRLQTEARNFQTSRAESATNHPPADSDKATSWPASEPTSFPKHSTGLSSVPVSSRPLSSVLEAEAGALSTILEATEPVSSVLTTTASSLSLDMDSDRNADDALDRVATERCSSDSGRTLTATHIQDGESRGSYTSRALIQASSLELASVATIMQRIREYGRRLEEQKELLSLPATPHADQPATPIFHTLQAASADGAKCRSSSNHKNNSSKFSLDAAFIRRVMSFERVSPLLSSSVSSSVSSTVEVAAIPQPRPARKTVATNIEDTSTEKSNLQHDEVDLGRRRQRKRPQRERPARKAVRSLEQSGTSVSEVDNYPPPLQIKPRRKFEKKEPLEKEEPDVLRYYIEKLLSMRHEDVENLSVSSILSSSTSNILSSTSTLSAGIQDPGFHNGKSAVNSSLKGTTGTSWSSSDSSSIKKVRFNLRRGEGSESLVSNYSLEQATSLDATLYRAIPATGHLAGAEGRRGESSQAERLTESADQRRIEGESSQAERLFQSADQLSTAQIQELYKRKRIELEEQLDSLQIQEENRLNPDLALSTGDLSSDEGSLDRLLAALEARIETSRSSASSSTSFLPAQHQITAAGWEKPGKETAAKIEIDDHDMLDKEPGERVDKLSFISETGTDSESGSRISYIDLSTDTSSA